MASWSLCMIVKNEEETLGRCLDSVSELFEQIVITDTGSEDATKEIARSYGCEVWEYEWGDDFAAARNFAFSKAYGDYIMWLDADDVLPERSRRRLLEEKQRPPGAFDVLMLPYHTGFDESGRVTFAYERERVVRRCPEAVWQGRVHEVIAPFGRVEHVDAPVEHRKMRPSAPGRNLRIYERMLREGAKLGARELYYYARELMYNGRYEDGARAFEEVLQREDGWAENRLDAYRQLSSCRRALGDEEGAVWPLLSALREGPPRPELCCDLGRYFFDKGEWQAASFWYKGALMAERGDSGFEDVDCRGYVPCIQLCCCFWQLGDMIRAQYWNERAGKYKPDSPAYLHNKTLFLIPDEK